MLEKILIFIVFLGPLIFFHELGHFLFARFFGVRVETFSMGFGPKLFKFRKGFTDYTISLIPMGGYVKMFGDDPLSDKELTDEEKKMAFTHKTKWARFWIVFGGPLANFILAYFLYAGLLFFGEKVPEPKIGVVSEKSELFNYGFRTGDVIKKVDGREIGSLDDLFWMNDDLESFVVTRGEQDVKLDYKIKQEDFMQSIGNLHPQIKAPLFKDSKSGNYFVLASSIDFDPYLTLEVIEQDTNNSMSLFQVEGKPELMDKLKLEKGAEAISVKASKDGWVKSLISKGFYPLELVIGNIVMDSPANKANLKSEDILSSIDGKNLYSFEMLRNTIQEKKDEVNLVIIRGSQKLEFNIKPQLKKIENETIYAIGIQPALILAKTKMVETSKKSLFESLAFGFNRTWDGIKKTFDGFVKLFTAEVPLKSIGGPLAIGKVASDYFEIGLSMFFRLMALISINLGIINLFPIPVLDGGHIVFLILEFFNRGPLSRKKMQVAQQVGFSLLMVLIFVALFNDMTRFF